LAVINFLPIPLLDGGHMVFLAWEGLRGRPASEKLVVALHTVGFGFIISLMAFVLMLDLGWIDRGL
jgi:regulator of sigma E protease